MSVAALTRVAIDTDILVSSLLNARGNEAAGPGPRYGTTDVVDAREFLARLPVP